MRIDPTYGYPTQGLDKSSSRSSKAGKGEASDKAAALPGSILESQADPYVDRIAALSDINADAVEAARKALADGELDTPEATRRAAQAILDQGL